MKKFLTFIFSLCTISTLLYSAAPGRGQELTFTEVILRELEQMSPASRKGAISQELSYAADKGDLATLNAILTAYPNAILIAVPINFDKKEILGNILLITAAKRGRKEIVNRLLEFKKIKLNTRDKYGMTALMYAAEKGNKEIVDMLLAEGANPTLINRANYTAAQLAREEGHEDIATTITEAIEKFQSARKIKAARG